MGLLFTRIPEQQPCWLYSLIELSPLLRRFYLSGNWLSSICLTSGTVLIYAYIYHILLMIPNVLTQLIKVENLIVQFKTFPI